MPRGSGALGGIAKEDGLTNLADIFTKLLAGPKLRELAGTILW